MIGTDASSRAVLALTYRKDVANLQDLGDMTWMTRNAVVFERLRPVVMRTLR